MPENPIGYALRGIGQTYRDITRADIADRELALRQTVEQGRTQRALEAIRLQNQRELRQLELRGTQEQARQLETRQRLGLAERQVTTQEAAQRAQERYQSGQLALQGAANRAQERYQAGLIDVAQRNSALAEITEQARELEAQQAHGIAISQENRLQQATNSLIDYQRAHEKLAAAQGRGAELQNQAAEELARIRKQPIHMGDYLQVLHDDLTKAYGEKAATQIVTQGSLVMDAMGLDPSRTDITIGELEARRDAVGPLTKAILSGVPMSDQQASKFALDLYTKMAATGYAPEMGQFLGSAMSALKNPEGFNSIEYGLQQYEQSRLQQLGPNATKEQKDALAATIQQARQQAHMQNAGSAGQQVLQQLTTPSAPAAVQPQQGVLGAIQAPTPAAPAPSIQQTASMLAANPEATTALPQLLRQLESRQISQRDLVVNLLTLGVPEQLATRIGSSVDNFRSFVQSVLSSQRTNRVLESVGSQAEQLFAPGQGLHQTLPVPQQ